MSSAKAVRAVKASPEAAPRKQYHHGDLRDSLLKQGLILLQEVGVEDISLRQLAERVGVSTPALYHHFKNKQELLYALGILCVDRFEQALFEDLPDSLSATMDGGLQGSTPDAASPQRQPGPADHLQSIVLAYVRFALQNPELYELLFGRRMWKTGDDSAFHQYAKKSFRKLSARLMASQQGRTLRADINPLRVAQVGWATVHGLCRMYNDGLAFSSETIEDIALYACQMLERALFTG